jgi:hypothetical protein
MKIREINRLRAGVVVPEFIGRVVKVYPPKEPTEGQRRSGIHKQTLEVQAADGENLRVVLIKPGLHIPTTESGKLFQFQSTKDEKGRLGGILTCEWHDEGRDEDHFYVELNGQAHFFAIKEDGETTTKPVPERTAGNRTAAAKQDHGEFTPSISDHVDFYCQIVESLENRLANSKLMDAFLQDPQPLMGAATSIFIQCTQNGTFRRFAKAAPVSSNAGAGQYEKPQQEHDGRYNERMLADDLHSGSVELDEDAIEKHKLNPEKVYDYLVEWWKDDGKLPVIIDACYDHLKKLMDRGGKNHVTAEDVCREIIRDYPGFMELFPKAEAAYRAQQEKKTQPESAPLSDGDAFNPDDVFNDTLVEA